ncbi:MULTISPECIES: hypothetical protein [unclassified Bradyrhizobium]|uniref:hypothetical protein n=1 Tax=unclassified Bradyrhizobium TaxID=2631580 RepID=UPI001BA9116F|nr:MULTISPECIES: hypothetical protein [unclassified Bradyrhizobium]WLA52394.1 hypothetical protein QIH80_21240 [Bradyrhizobium elkanii]MBR1206942.1 hypothetical protein [Bradyrhizobium sp. AUGA SZCCT0124]MBR1313481.1 hypothetical protein [Bradyrhizobium sp. AUGA SZCCT0051]MBR1343422.1 hypothetical protein [Bradyrhizobium sp. AUGA SZCCT0105]MBR1357158.1 hypothetical protein [Bradyrhizobium sp. AUGA SZCCT0045]
MTEAQELNKLVEMTKANTVATLAAAIITAAGRPFSVQQALDLSRDIQFAMYPANGFGAYEEWKKTSSEKLAKVYGPTGN